MGGGDPPELKDDSSYSQYKRDILIWQLATNIEGKRQAGRAILKIQGKVREHASRMSIEDLGSEDGLKRLITEVDKYFKKDATQELFLAIEKLENYRRDKQTSIVQYIEEFGRLNDRVKELIGNRDAYDDGILAYRLLKQASLSEQDQKLVRATVATLTYQEMVTALKRCLGDGVIIGSSDISLSSLKIKEEPFDNFHAEECDGETCYGNNQGFQHNNRGNRRGNFKGYNNKNNRNKQNNPQSSQQRSANSGSFSKSVQKNEKNSDSQDSNFKDSVNMRDKNTGEVLRCGICDSKKHFARDCQHKNASTMLQSAFKDHQSSILNIDEDYNSLKHVDETTNRALIDTGATMTVCGETWMEQYLDTLSDEEKGEVLWATQDMTFRFGDGRGIKSNRFATIPIHLCGKKLRLGTFGIEGDLPLLFSRKSLKEFGICLDIKEDKIVIDNKEQDLVVTSSGHYVADLIKSPLALVCKSDDVKKTAVKLHRYFGHPSAQKLVDLVKDTEYNSKELLKEIKDLSKTCEHCTIHQRNRPKPKVSLMTPKDVNDIVGMDIKDLSTGHHMFHCIDLFSRFSTTTIIPNKKKETIIEDLFQNWITIFGRPTTFLSDNGGEFLNEEFLDMCDELEIVFKTTAAYAPFSNGICERHNGIIADSYNKIINDVKCHPKIALAWSTNAKNSLANTHGYSPYMLVLGKEPSIPGLDNITSITSLNQGTVAKVLSDHLLCMQKSRKAFYEANQNAKVKRSLADRICQVEEKYYLGDQVYYKKEKQKRWSGPATVIGQEGKLVFIRHGGFVLRVHVTKIVLKIRANKEVIEQAEVKVKDPADMMRSNERTHNHLEENDTSDSEDDEVERTVNGNEEPSVSHGIREQIQDKSENVAQIEQEVVSSDGSSSEDVSETTLDGDISEWNQVSLKKNGVLDLPKGSEIRYRSEEFTGNEWESATVLGPAGKVKSKYKNNFNIKKASDDSIQYIPLDECEVVKKNEDADINVLYLEDQYQSAIINAINVPKEQFNDPAIKKAMDAELSAWKKYGVYKEVADTGQKTVSTRWVVTKKPKGIYKARLVVRGFEEQLEKHVDSPTGDKCSTKIMMALSKAHNWKVESIDIKSAFLQSQQLDRVVFVKPPRNLKKVGVIWQLEKPAYGLNDSPRNWYNSLREFLLSIGCVVCQYDPGLFYFRKNNKLMGILLLHVDDFLIGGNLIFKKEVMSKVFEKYEVSNHVSSSTFKYIGMNISQDEKFVTVEQFDYAENVKIIDLEVNRRLQKESLLTPEEKTHYLSLLGKLSWLSYISRPDLKWDVYNMSRLNKSPTVKDLLDLNKVVTKLNVKKRIRLPKLDLKSGLQIIVHSDASFGTTK